MLQFSKSTSPTSFDLVSPFSSILILLIPTSIITEPGLTQLDFTKFGLPTAATRISLFLQISSIFFVFEWTTVTVQFSDRRRLNIGLPTIFDRPITVAFFPSKFPTNSLNNIKQPNGVHGTIDFWPVFKSPTFEI